MKIGILTFHLAHNYGAVLQCYALQEVLHGMGHDVRVVDYQQPFMTEYFKPRMSMGVRSFCKALLHGEVREYLYRGLLPYIKSRNFKLFRSRHLLLTEKCHGTGDVPAMDLYIVGSDQPWNPDLTGGPDLVYWGQFSRPVGSRIFTYAMSGSEKAISKVGWDNVKQYCKRFDALSFREESNARRFSGLTGQTCQTVLDPTLIADADLWQPLLNKKWSRRHYVLLYHVGGPKEAIEAMTQNAKAMAISQGLEFIDASRYLYSPADFVSLIRYAECVITASFHALAFSIIFHKSFCAVKTGQASDIRQTSLLRATGLEQYFMEASAICLPQQPDYAKATENLAPLRAASLQFIHQQLNNQ